MSNGYVLDDDTLGALYGVLESLDLLSDLSGGSIWTVCLNSAALSGVMGGLSNELKRVLSGLPVVQMDDLNFSRRTGYPL